VHLHVGIRTRPRATTPRTSVSIRSLCLPTFFAGPAVRLFPCCQVCVQARLGRFSVAPPNGSFTLSAPAIARDRFFRTADAATFVHRVRLVPAYPWDSTWIKMPSKAPGCVAAEARHMRAVLQGDQARNPLRFVALGTMGQRLEDVFEARPG
jgi:hypothetical protein